jgi:hypothetical protein
MHPMVKIVFTFIARQFFAIPGFYVFPEDELMNYIYLLLVEDDPWTARALDCSAIPDCNCYFCSHL